MAFKITVALLWAAIAITNLTFFSQAMPGGIETKLPRRQWIAAYKNEGSTLTSEYFNITAEVSDLSAESYVYPSSGSSLNDNVRSVCGAGVWVFYEHSDFEGDFDLVKLKNGDCSDLHKTAADVSSVRPVGDILNYLQPTLTFFVGTDYNKDSVTLERSTSRISRQHRSFIITGSSNWSLFDQVGFEGHSICLIPVADSYMQAYGIQDFTLAPYNISVDYIKSVQKGCSGNETQVIVGSGIRLVSKYLFTISALFMNMVIFKTVFD